MTEEFETAAATVFAAMIKVNIAQTLPHLAQCDREAVFLSVLDRMANAYGFAVRPSSVAGDDDAEV